MCNPDLRAIHDGKADVSIEGDTIETDKTRSGVTDEYQNNDDDLLLIGVEKQYQRQNGQHGKTNNAKSISNKKHRRPESVLQNGHGSTKANKRLG